MNPRIENLLPTCEPVIKQTTALRMIPVSTPLLNGNEEKYILECIRSSWISSRGTFIKRFEDSFKAHIGSKYAVACSSGTAALHLALAALNLQRKDEVIIPTFTMISTANVVSYLGAQPVLIDADPITYNLDVNKIENKITKYTKAIMPVHTYGLAAKMDKILALAKKYSLFVIEDAAEAHGGEYQSRKVGSFGDMGCFSFYGNKIITTGEGGMVTTNNKTLARKVRLLRDFAFSRERHFWHRYLGYNYRMTNLQAAVGLAQSERFKQLLKLRIKNAEYYNNLLKNIKGIRLPPKIKGIKNVYWMYAILVEDEFGIDRDALRRHLAECSIETRTFFIPMHLQPIYYPRYKKEKFPVAENLCKRGMYLPSGATLKKKDIEYIADCIKQSKR